MEIKTLEQYAIAKINDLENENATLKHDLEVAHTKIKALQDVFTEIKNDFRIKYLKSIKTAVIDLEPVFESSRPEKYDWYLKTFGLKEPEKENSDEQE